MKILDVQSEPQNRGCLLRLTLAGIGGRACPLQVVTSFSKLQAGGLLVRKTGLGYEIVIPFEGSSYVTRQVCLSQ